MLARDTPVLQLDTVITRSISPGGCPSAGDVDMASPISWASLPDRPRTSQSRRPSFSVSNAPESIPPSAWRIQPGQYVAFSLDTEAVAGTTGHPDGSNEKNAIRQFPVGRYIGLVVGSAHCALRRTRAPGRAQHRGILHAHRAVPGRGGGQDANAPPIRTKTLFPWKDRVQWTTFGTRLQITHLHESKLSFDMDEDEFARCEARVAADMDKMEDVLVQSGGEGPIRDGVGKLRPSPEPFPATVWRDIRGEHGADPTAFVAELYALDGLMQQLAAGQSQ
ncbi:hypothetical protein C8Q77DRAFT_1074302 [Trametes polyzona]|nr:hypothetical protein C8Q77DRAFT_1074302 [Trametes polyzona]